MAHCPELAGLDALHDLLRRAVKDVVVILDQVTAGLLRASSQSLELLEGRGYWLLVDDMGAGIERVHRQTEMGGRWRGDVDDIGAGLFQHGLVVGEPRSDAVPLGGSLRRGGREVADGRQLD